MKPEDGKLVQEMVDLIRRLVRSVYLDSLKMSKQFGLTGPQSTALRALSIGGPMSSADLSKTLYVTPSNITGIIDRLEKKAYVARMKKEGDRRVTLVRLTDAGRKLCETMPDPIEKKLIAGLSKLKPEQARSLSDAMGQIIDFINAPDLPEGLPLELTHIPATSETSCQQGETTS